MADANGLGLHVASLNGEVEDTTIIQGITHGHSRPLKA
jgi:hypothetical protein